LVISKQWLELDGKKEDEPRMVIAVEEQLSDEVLQRNFKGHFPYAERKKLLRSLQTKSLRDELFVLVNFF